MQAIIVKTGFGYYEDGQGHVLVKAELPIGVHYLADGLNYIEVDTKAELDSIVVWENPVELEKQKNERKVRDKIRADAIAQLIKDGELPSDYQ